MVIKSSVFYLCLRKRYPSEAGRHAGLEDREQGTWAEWHCQPKQRQILCTCDVEARSAWENTKLESFVSKLKLKVEWPRSNLHAVHQCKHCFPLVGSRCSKAVPQ